MYKQGIQALMHNAMNKVQKSQKIFNFEHLSLSVQEFPAHLRKQKTQILESS